MFNPKNVKSKPVLFFSCARRILRVKVSLSKLGSHSARAMQGDKIKTTNSKFAKKYLKCEYL